MKNKSVQFFTLVVALLLFTKSVFADEETAKKEIPYKLVEGKQYEICNTLLPFINTVPHGALRDQPGLLERVKGFKLPEWNSTKDYKYVDLLIKYSKQYFPEQFADEKYEENFKKFSGYVEKGEIRFFTSHIDVDNSGKKRPVLRRDEWFKERRRHDYLYFSYDENSMEVDRQYPRESDVSFIFFNGRTFRFSEWPVGGDVNRWKIEIDEPYYSENRAPEFGLSTRPICVFSSK